MRMTVRWKLIVMVGLPVLATYLAILSLDYLRLRRVALEQTQKEAERFADYYASKVESRLELVAQVARSAAAFVSAHPDLTEEEVYAILEANVEQNPLVFGSCLAFEPGAFDGKKHLFAPYVFRAAGGKARKDVAQHYNYTDEKWEWYGRTKALMRPRWTEPFFDEGGGDIVMCTYSAPVFRGDKFIAVMTVDLPIQELQDRLDDFPKHGESVFFITARGGTYISHPSRESIMKRSLQQDAADMGEPRAIELARRALAGERGAGVIPAPMSPEVKLLVFFSPIRSTGWSFIAAQDLSQPMREANLVMGGRAALSAGGVCAILAVIFVTGSWITRPVRALMQGVRSLAAGNLNTRIEVGNAGDEITELARTFNSMTGDLREHVDALAESRAARQSVESELRVGKDIQTSLLPGEFPSDPAAGFVLHAACEPARQVGGDFYDFFTVPGGDLLMVIADVSGKGVPAAIYMAMARTLIRDLGREGRSPSEIAHRANEALVEESMGSGMFLTTFIAIYKPSDGRMRYACAGHLPPLRVSREGEVTVLNEPADTVLGIVEGVKYGEWETSLKPGEKLLMFTDGVTEARAPGGEFFGDERLVAMAHAWGKTLPRECCGELVSRLRAFENGDQHDDITVMVLERMGGEMG